MSLNLFQFSNQPNLFNESHALVLARLNGQFTKRIIRCKGCDAKNHERVHSQFPKTCRVCRKEL